MQLIGESAALGAALLWSFSSFVFTTAIRRIGTTQINFYRLFLASVFLIITIAIFNIEYLISMKQLIFLTISGGIGLLLGDTYLFKAFKESGPRISMLIMSSNPALAAVLAYFFLGETLSLWGILGIAITLAGISIVVLEEPMEGNNNNFKVTRKGIIYGILAAFGQAVGLIFAKFAYFEGDMHSITATFVRITSALILMIPFIMFSAQMKNPIKLFSKDLKSLGLVLTGSIIGPYLGITFSYIAIVYTKIGIASTLMSTVPILMLPLAVIIYKEKLSYKAIIGAFLAVGGVSILFLK